MSNVIEFKQPAGTVEEVQVLCYAQDHAAALSMVAKLEAEYQPPVGVEICDPESVKPGSVVILLFRPGRMDFYPVSIEEGCGDE